MMRMQTMRRLLSAVMCVVMLVTMLIAALPTVTAEAAASSGSLLPTSATKTSGSGTVSANANALSVKTNGTGAVVASLSGSSFYLDADGFNALSLSVNTTAATSLTLKLTNGSGSTVSLTSANHFARSTHLEDGKLPVGDCGAIVLDIAKLTGWNNTLVTISSITVQTTAAASVVFYGMEATVKEAAPTGVSLLPSSVSSWGATDENGVVSAVNGGYSLALGTGNWTASPYDFSANAVQASLFSQLYYNIDVEQGASVMLFFEHVQSDAFNTLNLGWGRHVFIKINSLIDKGNSSIDAAIREGHYEGTISMADIMALLPEYHPGGSCYNGSCTVYDLVKQGTVRIGAIKLFASGDTMTVYDLAVVESEYMRDTFSLMPSAEVAAAAGLSYDSNGWLTYKTTAASTSMEIPVGKYIDIDDLNTMMAAVTFSFSGSQSVSNYAWDFGVRFSGYHKTGDYIESKMVYLWDNWGASSSNQWHTPQKNAQSNLSVKQDYYSALYNYSNICTLDNTVYVESFRVRTGAAGTLKIRGMALATSSSEAMEPAPVSLSLGDLNAEPGETVMIPLVLDSATGIMNFDATIAFDSNYLSIDKNAIYWNTDVLDNTTNADSSSNTSTGFHSANIVGGNKLKLAYIATENTAASGTIVEIPVTVKQSVPAGMYPLTLTVGDLSIYSTIYSSSPYYDYFYSQDEINIDNGSVTVKSTAEEGTVELSVGSGEVLASETVSIPVSISADHFMKSATVKIMYDATALSITKSNVKFTTDYAGTVTVSGGVITVKLSNTTTTAAAGTLFTMTFTAAETLTDGVSALNATVSDYTAMQGGYTYYPTAKITGGSITLRNVIMAERDMTLTVDPQVQANIGKNDIVKVDILMNATGAVASLSNLALRFDKSQITPVKQGDGYVTWSDAVAGGTSAYANGVLTMSSGAINNTANSDIVIGSVYFTMNTNSASAALSLSGASAMLTMPDEPDAVGGKVAVDTFNYVGGSFTIGAVTTTTTTTTTKLPSIGSNEVQFLVTSSSDTVATEQTVTVDIVLNSPKGVQNFDLLLSVDTSMLTPVKQNGSWIAWNTAVLGSDDLDGASRAYMANYNASLGEMYLGYVAAGVNSAKSGVIGTITFKVNANVVPTNVASKNTTLELECEAVTWNDPSNANADDYGDVTPNTIKLTNKTLTVLRSFKVEYYKSNKSTLLTTAILPEGSQVSYETPAGVDTDNMNYTFLGWKLFDSDASDGVVKMYPAYGYTIEVANGSLTGSYVATDEQWMNMDGTKAYFNAVRTDFAGHTGLFGYDNRVQVIADKKAGKTFSHWTDQYGNIVSYSEIHTFYVPCNLLLVAHYDDAVVKTPQVSLQTLRSVTSSGKTNMTWVCDTAEAAGYTITDMGIVLSPQENYSLLTNPDGKNAVELKANGRSEHSWQYSVTVNNVAAGKARYAVAYVKYTDSKGNAGVAYSTNYMGMIAPAQ